MAPDNYHEAIQEHSDKRQPRQQKEQEQQERHQKRQQQQQKQPERQQQVQQEQQNPADLESKSRTRQSRFEDIRLSSACRHPVPDVNGQIRCHDSYNRNTLNSVKTEVTHKPHSFKPPVLGNQDDPTNRCLTWFINFRWDQTHYGCRSISTAQRRYDCRLLSSAQRPRLEMGGLLLRLLLLLSYARLSSGVSDEKRLIKFLLESYEKVGIIGRPVRNTSETIDVQYGLALVQILDLDEKNQILTTNCWSKYNWRDYLLAWDPADFGGVQSISVPIAKIWSPDIVLYNYADQRLKEHREALAVVDHNGMVFWKPQAIYKSACIIDITHFPFDIQECPLKFGSWTYDGFKLDINFYLDMDHIDIDTYVESNEWVMLDHPAKKNVVHYSCCPEPYPDITFKIKIKRIPMFFSYILVLPCVLLSFLTLVIFWLPPESPAKMMLGMNIFVAFFVLLLLLADSTPPARYNIPLIGAYFCMNMLLITLSSFLAIIVINTHIRGDRKNKVPKWLKRIAIDWLARVLCMSEFLDKEVDASKSSTARRQRSNNSNQQRQQQPNDIFDTSASASALRIDSIANNISRQQLKQQLMAKQQLLIQQQKQQQHQQRNGGRRVQHRPDQLEFRQLASFQSSQNLHPRSRRGTLRKPQPPSLLDDYNTSTTITPSEPSYSITEPFGTMPAVVGVPGVDSGEGVGGVGVNMRRDGEEEHEGRGGVVGAREAMRIVSEGEDGGREAGEEGRKVGEGVDGGRGAGGRRHTFAGNNTRGSGLVSASVEVAGALQHEQQFLLQHRLEKLQEQRRQQQQEMVGNQDQLQGMYQLQQLSQEVVQDVELYQPHQLPEQLEEQQQQLPPRRPVEILRNHQLESDIREVRCMLKLYIKRLSDKDTGAKVHKEWRIVARVFDRLFFFMYIATIIVSLATIFPRDISPDAVSSTGA